MWHTEKGSDYTRSLRMLCEEGRGDCEHQSACVPWLDMFWIPFCVSPSLYCRVSLCHGGMV